MKLPIRLPAGLARFWRGCRIEEKVILCAASLVVPFCVGFEYSMQRNRAPLPPLFIPAPLKKLNEKTPASRAAKTFLLVHVSGKVRRPGLQKLPRGARVFQAIAAAGGATDDKLAQNLNLAARVNDGQKIVVGIVENAAQSLPPAISSTRSSPSASVSPAERRSTRKPLPAAPINVNAATAEELQKLPGVGPALAARIVAARAQKRFSTLNDLDAVPGIGSKKLEAMSPYVIF